MQLRVALICLTSTLALSGCDGDSCADNDADGVCDSDLCVGDDESGDSDGDGVCDDLDVCSGNDALGDEDGDGVCADLDACAGADATGDSDGDRVCDDVDLCMGNDAFGDIDEDGVCQDIDLCQGVNSTGDYDQDGLCDDIDPRLEVAYANVFSTGLDVLGVGILQPLVVINLSDEDIYLGDVKQLDVWNDHETATTVCSVEAQGTLVAPGEAQGLLLPLWESLIIGPLVTEPWTNEGLHVSFGFSNLPSGSAYSIQAGCILDIDGTRVQLDFTLHHDGGDVNTVTRHGP